MKKFSSLLKFIIPSTVLIYSMVVLLYVVFSSAFKSSTATRILTSLSTAALIICLWCVSQYVLNKLNTSPRTRYIILCGVFVTVSAVMAISTPFSPAYDAYDTCGFLEKLMQGKNTDYMTSYFLAYYTNHLTTLIYLPFVNLFGHIETGVRVLNVLLLCSSGLLISGSCKKMFGRSCGEMSLILLSVVFPSMLMVGPYIYPPTVFLASCALFLYHGKSIWTKIGFLVIGGLLFTLRPVACGFIFVYILFENCFTAYKKHRLIINIGKTSVVLICFIAVKSIVGSVLYYTNIHPYPASTDVSLLWTTEVGTRPNGVSSGLCTYFPYEAEGFDEISTQFVEIWDQYSNGSNADFEYIKELKQDIKNNLVTRAKTTLFGDFGTLYNTYKAKFKNYHRDDDRPYYYIANIYSPDFGDNVAHNYEKRYFLYMNAFRIVFCACSIYLLFTLLYLAVRGKQTSAHLSRAVALIIGITATSVLSILITEVGKRLLFDIFVPMCPVICYGLYSFALIFKGTKVKTQKAAVIAGALASAVCLFGCYNAYNIPVFRNSNVTFTDETVNIEFAEKITEDGFSVVLRDGSEIPLQGKSELKIPNGENGSPFFHIKLPDGELYQISKLRRQ